ncbi:GNAT family N-acetyltransferase [Reyranella sp.]|jgi:ribosomal protein S18 acetylase RimI-like enzyme|uniref:GNAT family N-acetyltransferase n=1 Tax=Reyranella sp. TaxID=1929291 RepID=UPI002F9396F6
MSRLVDLGRIRELESRGFRAWPALRTQMLAGWAQRFADGYTKRANSINALDPDCSFTADLRDALERPYRERGMPPIWRLTPLAPAEADQALARLGYRRIDESLVQVAVLDARFAADAEVMIASVPSGAWLARFAELSPVAPVHRPTMTRMLASIAAPVGFAEVEQAGRLVAFALGVVDGDHVGLFDVLVAPEARRRGLARRLTQSIGAWGRRHGARFAYLQVVATNVAARPLYSDLGFETVYSYAYRVP